MWSDNVSVWHISSSAHIVYIDQFSSASVATVKFPLPVLSDHLPVCPLHVQATCMPLSVHPSFISLIVGLHSDVAYFTFSDMSYEVTEGSGHVSMTHTLLSLTSLVKLLWVNWYQSLLLWTACPPVHQQAQSTSLSKLFGYLYDPAGFDHSHELPVCLVCPGGPPLGQLYINSAFTTEPPPAYRTAHTVC